MSLHAPAPDFEVVLTHYQNGTLTFDFHSFGLPLSDAQRLVRARELMLALATQIPPTVQAAERQPRSLFP